MRPLTLVLCSVLFAGLASAQPSSNAEKKPGETRYLAFQIFTYGPDPRVASMGEGTNPVARFPERSTLRDYIEDIKRRIGTVGDPQTHLAVILGHLSFDHGDAEVTRFIELAFNLALETEVAVGFHIDDSMFWAKRKDLWSDPSNVEALDWDGTPCTSRRLDWQTGPGAQPDAAPPQMCFNSKVIQREVRQRSALIGKAIQAGVNQLQQRNRPELFAGVIAGSETMIGQDLKTGKYLGYRAMLNRGFSREHPPKNLDLERESVVQEFIELWTKGLADAGVSPQEIYSHTAFLSYRVFDQGNDEKATYSQHNHFAPPSVAFGKYHRPGFSTYPQPGLFDQIDKELARHKQAGWASCEGTNLQLGSGPGQSGMNMETYLAKMFNHGASLVNIFSWGIGGEANKNMSFRVVTEGEEALKAYRKFLKGEPLIEAKTEGLTLLERLPRKIHKIQKELPSWIEKADDSDKVKATTFMQKLDENLKAKDFNEVEKTADSILKMMGISALDMADDARQKTDDLPITERLPSKIQKIQQGLPAWVQKTGNREKATALMKTLEENLKANNLEEAEKTADSILKMLGTIAETATQDIPEEVRKRLVHDLGSSFLVFRVQVQEELKLTKEQKDKLEQHLRELLPDAMQLFQKIDGLEPEEREKELRAYRQKAKEKLASVPKDTLNEGQRTRLRQLVLQREGLFGDGEAWNELQVTPEQRKQFMALIQQTHKKIQPLMEEAQKGGNPDEIRPKVMKMRKDLQDKLEALLTDAQRKQWKEMLGKTVDLGTLFDLSSR